MLPPQITALGATMRLTRLVVTDQVPGERFIKAPLTRLGQRHLDRTGAPPRWWWMTEGLDCPFCVGLWIALGVAAVESSPASRWKAWRALALGLTLNEVAAHLGLAVGDYGGRSNPSAGTPVGTSEEQQA